MSYRFTQTDLDYLRSDVGKHALAQFTGLAIDDRSMLADLTKVRKHTADHGTAVVETIRLRRRAIAKLGARSATWLLTDEALQQASPEPVAAHRARRLTGLAIHDVTCSIGADLVHLSRTASVAIGSDLHPIRAQMAAFNMATTGERAEIVVADALVPVSRGLLPYADPARRDGAGRRILSADTVPRVADLDEVWAHRPPVLRVPPGIDYEALARPGEVEIVSLDGSAREAVLWPQELARVARRATVLLSGGEGYELTSDDSDDIPVAPVGAWIVDPDAAVVRSHLVRHFAARHGLWQLDPHLAYLTGNLPPRVGRAFKVLDSAPYSERTVGEWLQKDGAGTVEIKVRGVDIEPDALRVRLRKYLTGPKSVDRTIVLARVGRNSMAYLTLAALAP
ncbi:class I SAM-dependent methyltransferase [Nakamurella antarctica]|uniref:Class I SAM-dependent methyltransferase n=1 Tax=Nakamurella antarctica TaxID=1902245 RepID=A0A3G8ZM63_9ACTN|nr:class I SAM-dependent methyltransferase [Nakamurella antarctica]AZI57867.1 class I SAM-dependent methyltransferase [Nakamurella antarctica]